MSFSQDVKEELINHYTKAKHCQMAELSALLQFDEKNVVFEEEKGCWIYSFTSFRNMPSI